MSKERYELDDSERFSEVLRLTPRAATRRQTGRYGYRWINVGEHLAAVLVIGADQAEADARAVAIVEAMNR